MSLKIYTIETRSAFIPGAAAYALGIHRATVQGHVYVAMHSKKAAIERLKKLVTHHANARNVHIATGDPLDAMVEAGLLAVEGQLVIKDSNGPKVVLYGGEDAGFIFVGKVLWDRRDAGHKCVFEPVKARPRMWPEPQPIIWERVTGGDKIDALAGRVGEVVFFTITGHSMESGYTLRARFDIDYQPPVPTIEQAKENAIRELESFLDGAGLIWKDQK